MESRLEEVNDAGVDVSADFVRDLTPESTINNVPQNQRNPTSLFTSTSTPPIKTVKEVKRGLRALVPPKSCGVSFERCPVWLWTLRPAEWFSITISLEDERRLHLSYRATWEMLREKFLVVDTVDSGQAMGFPVVWWLSGSESFEAASGVPASVPTVIWRASTERRTPKSTEAIRWLQRQELLLALLDLS